MPAAQICGSQPIFELYVESSTLKELGLHIGYSFNAEEETLVQVQENNVLSCLCSSYQCDL